jgi:hypothetical protein
VRKALRIAVGLFAAIGIAYVVFAALLAFDVIGTRCHGAIAMVVPSPSNAMFARVETQSCDDGPIETIVSLSTDRGNHVGTRSVSFFRAASYAQEAHRGAYAPVPVRIVWLSETELELAYPHGLDARMGEGTYNGVVVRMREY